MLQKMNKVNILSDDKILYWKIKLMQKIYDTQRNA